MCCVFLEQATRPPPPSHLIQPPAYWTLVKENSRLQEVKKKPGGVEQRHAENCEVLHNPDPNLCLTPHWFWALLLIPHQLSPGHNPQPSKSLLTVLSINDELNFCFVLGENIIWCQYLKWKWIQSFPMKGKISIIYPVIFLLYVLNPPHPPTC